MTRKLLKDHIRPERRWRGCHRFPARKQDRLDCPRGYAAGLATPSGIRALARLERAKGIEPSYAAWEAAVLPLNYARKSLPGLINLVSADWYGAIFARVQYRGSGS